MNQNDQKQSPVQVFELTMDNDEDQDELNRRFRKPGDPTKSRRSHTEGDATTNGFDVKEKPAESK